MMEWISGFTITILCVVLITSICDALMPEGNLSKYVRMILGLIVMITVVSTALGITKIDFDSVFALEDAPILNKQNAALEYNRQIVESFKSNVEDNAEQYILEHFGTESKVEATIETDEEGSITRIEKLSATIEIQGIDFFSIGRDLANLYGLKEWQVTVGGAD